MRERVLRKDMEWNGNETKNPRRCRAEGGRLDCGTGQRMDQTTAMLWTVQA
jgi:hypothetical protein